MQGVNHEMNDNAVNLLYHSFNKENFSNIVQYIYLIKEKNSDAAKILKIPAPEDTILCSWDRIYRI
jgi:hypothetical protein